MIKSLFKDKKEDNNYYNERLSQELEALKREKIEMEKMKKENEMKLKELEQNMKNNILQERERIEREKEIKLREKEREEHEKKLEENRRKQEAIKKCKESLSSEYTQGILKAMRKYNEEEEKWLNSLNDPNIQTKLKKMKKKLNSLFEELFQNQRILEKMNRKFLNILENISNKKELNRMNFMIIGSSGVGKSTLINGILGEYLAEEGSGKRCTAIGKRYISKKMPFITLFDSVGTEIGKGHTLEDVQEDTLDEITKNLNINDPNEHIHCIVYCTTSNRIFEDELKVILKIREKYDGKRLPIVIVYTRALDDNEVEAKKGAINEFLSKYGEKISNDIFGITFIKVHAKEYLYERNGQKFCDSIFGLAELVETCYKKGEKSYKIAIKNSLVEIAKNSFYSYIQKISESLVNNINFYLYLSQKFDPNFSDFISYSFEKLTDIENQEGINENELKNLEVIVEGKTPNIKEIKESSSISNNYNNISNSKSVENECMFCHKNPINPYVCEFCEAKACEECYYRQFEYKDKPTCLLCYGQKFKMETECPSNSNNIEDNDYKEDDRNNGNNLSNSFISSFNILKNNLNLESKNSIRNYVEEFRNEMLVVVNQKFDDFTEKAVKTLYYELLEKYREKTSDNNININEAMKSKEEITYEASNAIKNQLKGPAEENFLKKSASCLFQDIVKICEAEMARKIKQFIENLNNNSEVNKFFDSNDALNDDKNLAIEPQFKELIKGLRKKEEESQEKALKLQFGMPLNESQGESKSSDYGDSNYESQSNSSSDNYGQFNNENKEESYNYSAGY